MARVLPTQLWFEARTTPGFVIQKESNMSNPFKSALYRRQYDKAVAAYQNKDKFLFHGDQPHRSNSWAATFWAGFNGIEGGLFRPTDSTYRRSPSYVLYRAGKDCAATSKQEEKPNV